MADLSLDQADRRAAIQKSATIWGAVAGAVAGLLAFWILGGQGPAIRFGGAIVIAGVAGVLVSRASFKSGSKSAQCEKCGAAYSRSRTDRAEALASSETKQERKEQPDGSTEVTSWTEDTYNVTDTYTCAKCGDATTKAYQTSRRRDETTLTEPAPSRKTAAPDPASGKSTAARAKSSRSGSAGSGKGKAPRN